MVVELCVRAGVVRKKDKNIQKFVVDERIFAFMAQKESQSPWVHGLPACVSFPLCTCINQDHLTIFAANMATVRTFNKDSKLPSKSTFLASGLSHFISFCCNFVAHLLYTCKTLQSTTKRGNFCGMVYSQKMQHTLLSSSFKQYNIQYAINTGATLDDQST